jgi:hypothetical protein
MGAGIGGGLGAFGPAVSRFAGGALANTALANQLAPTAYKASQLFARSPGASSLINPLLQQKAGVELIGKGGAALAGLGLSAAIPTVASGIAGATPQIFGGGSRKAGDALRGSMQLLGAGKEVTTPGATGDVNLAGPPSLGQYGPDSYTDVAALNSAARGQMLRGEMETRSQLEQMKTLMPYQYEMINKAANADFLRQGAGAQLRTRLAQGAQAMLQAQLGAQALAQQGNQAMLQAATMRGGYV